MLKYTESMAMRSNRTQQLLGFFHVVSRLTVVTWFLIRFGVEGRGGGSSVKLLLTSCVFFDFGVSDWLGFD